MKRTLTSFLLALPLVSACGGGSNGQDVPPPVNFAITPANAAAATGAAWESANASAGMAERLGDSGIIATAPGATAKPAAAATGSLTSLVQKIPFGPDTFPCQLSGSITVSGDLSDPFTLTPGDFINVDADACDDGLGEVIDGLLETAIDAFAGDFFGGAYELTATLQATGLQVTTATDVSTVNGDATVALDTTAVPAVSASVSGNSLSTDTNSASATLSNYLTEQTLNAGVSPSPYTLASSGTLDSSALAGVISYSTPVVFEGFDTNYPHAGELLVTGGGSSARLIAIDEIDVRIEVDTDGDGVVDETIETTWAALTG